MSDWEVVPEDSNDWEKSSPNFAERYVYPFAAGVAQGPVDLYNLASKYNLPLRAINELAGAGIKKLGGPDIPTVSNLNLREYLPEDYSRGAFQAGDIAGLLMPFAGPIKRGVSTASKIPTALSSEKTGKAMLAKFLEKEGLAKGKIKDVFSEASKLGVENVPVHLSSKEMKYIKRILKPQAYDRYFSGANRSIGKKGITEKLTPEESNFLRSELDKFTAKYLEHENPSNRELAKFAYQKSQQLRDSLYNNFEKINPELNKKFGAANEFYANEYAPYTNVTGNFFKNAAKKPGQKKYLPPEYLPGKALEQGGAPFRSVLMKEHPELQLYSNLRDPLLKKTVGYGLTGIGAGTLGSSIYDYLTHQ